MEFYVLNEDSDKEGFVLYDDTTDEYSFHLTREDCDEYSHALTSRYCYSDFIEMGIWGPRRVNSPISRGDYSLFSAAREAQWIREVVLEEAMDALNAYFSEEKGDEPEDKGAGLLYLSKVANGRFERIVELERTIENLKLENKKLKELLVYARSNIAYMAGFVKTMKEEMEKDGEK